MNIADKAGTKTRRRILRAAQACFAERGFLGTSTREIATAAGTAQGLLRYHFETKEALWRAVIDAVFAQIGQTYPLDDAAPELSTREKLDGFISGFIEFSAREPALFALMTHESWAPSARHEWLLETHVRPYFEATQAAIQEGQREGVVRNTDPVLLYYAIIGIVGAAFSYGAEVKVLRGAPQIGDREQLQSLINDLVFI